MNGENCYFAVIKVGFVLFFHHPVECSGPPVYVLYFNFEFFSSLFPFPFYPSPIPRQNLILFCSHKDREGEKERERRTPPGSEVVDSAAAASPGQPTAAAPTRRRAGRKLVDGVAAASLSYSCPPRPPPLAHAAWCHDSAVAAMLSVGMNDEPEDGSPGAVPWTGSSICLYSQQLCSACMSLGSAGCSLLRSEMKSR